MASSLDNNNVGVWAWNRKQVGPSIQTQLMEAELEQEGALQAQAG